MSSLCASDALLYSKNYDDGTKFIVCAICGHEGSLGKSKTIAECDTLIKMSGLKERFSCLTAVRANTIAYDKIFIGQLTEYFVDGLIKGLDKICGSCCYQLKYKRGSQYNTEYESDGNNDLPIDPAPVDDKRDPGNYIPRLALFNGLFSGSIPTELTGLTSVEESMINIYSAITKMVPAGGKHYKLKGCTCYTIINDLTSVAKRLPRMPSIEDSAILRHKKDLIGKDYTYRPYKVFTALTWLKKNNHLYQDIDLVWPNDILYWQLTVCPVDIPFIEITDDDVNDFGDDSSDDDNMSDDHTTNTGM
jgi:hypothetical protein